MKFNVFIIAGLFFMCLNFTNSQNIAHGLKKNGKSVATVALLGIFSTLLSCGLFFKYEYPNYFSSFVKCMSFSSLCVHHCYHCVSVCHLFTQRPIFCIKTVLNLFSISFQPITVIFYFNFSVSILYGYWYFMDIEKKLVIPGRIYNTTLNYEQKLCIYCYRGIHKHILHIFQTAFLMVDLNSNEYDLYKGSSIQDVLLMYENHKSSWTNQLFSWKSGKIDLDPFNLNCIGIETSLDHKVVVNIIRIDFWRVFRLVVGIFLFIAAPKLSSNPIFYYICGVTLGITMSFLIALYLLSKLIPKKPTVYAFFIGGWAVGVYLFQLLWENIKIIATNYHTHLLTYVLVTGLISFVVCYRFGPVTDPRSKNLIKWTMQVASIALIFHSSRCQEASALFVLLLLFYYNFPMKWRWSFLSLWRRTFPQKVKRLTEDEYHEEGARETVKALEELRKYCSSPKCNQWKTVLSLQKPIRFAEFMEGKSHLEDSEILAYESESQKSMALLTDDSESENEIA